VASKTAVKALIAVRFPFLVWGLLNVQNPPNSHHRRANQHHCNTCTKTKSEQVTSGTLNHEKFVSCINCSSHSRRT
jgi:hypothetical protein